MNAKTTNLRRLDESRLCCLCNDLSNRVWTCRRRRWTRKLAQAQLGQALAELSRRIDAEQVND